MAWGRKWWPVIAWALSFSLIAFAIWEVSAVERRTTQVEERVAPTLENACAIFAQVERTPRLCKPGEESSERPPAGEGASSRGAAGGPSSGGAGAGTGREAGPASPGVEAPTSISPGSAGAPPSGTPGLPDQGGGGGGTGGGPGGGDGGPAPSPPPAPTSPAPGPDDSVLGPAIDGLNQGLQNACNQVPPVAQIHVC